MCAYYTFVLYSFQYFTPSQNILGICWIMICGAIYVPYVTFWMLQITGKFKHDWGLLDETFCMFLNLLQLKCRILPLCLHVLLLMETHLLHQQKT